MSRRSYLSFVLLKHPASSTVIFFTEKNIGGSLATILTSKWKYSNEFKITTFSEYNLWLGEYYVMASYCFPAKLWLGTCVMIVFGFGTQINCWQMAIQTFCFNFQSGFEGGEFLSYVPYIISNEYSNYNVHTDITSHELEKLVYDKLQSHL